MTYQLFVSAAFRDLKPSAKDILQLIYFEIEMTSQKKRGKYIPVITNRNNIKLPYEEIMERTGYGKKAVWTAFKDILAHGFIEVVHHGGGTKGDLNIYGITEDWRKWEPGQVIRELGRNGKVGWQSQNKISSPVGNPNHSPVGNPETQKKGGRFPVGNPESTQECPFQELG